MRVRATSYARPYVLAVTEYFAGPRCRIGHSGPLILMCLEGAVEVADLDQLERCQELLSRQFKRVSIVTVMNSGFMSINKGVGERGAQIAERFREYTGANIIVINGKGLMAVMARTGLAAFSMLDRSGNRLKAFGNVPEALSHLEGAMQQLGTPLSAADLSAVAAYINAKPLS